MSDPLLGIIFGLVAMVSLGIGAAVIQAPARKLGAVQSVILRNAVLVLSILVGVLSGLFAYHYDSAVLIPALLIGAFGYIALQFFYQGLSVGKVGVVVPIASSYPLITVLLSVFLYGEQLSGIHSLGIAIIIIGGILLSARFSDWKKSGKIEWNAGVLFAVFTLIGWGVWSFALKVPVSIVGPILTSLFVEIATLLAAGFHFTVTRQKWVPVDMKIGKWIVVAGILGAVGSFAYNWGIHVADVSLVVVLAACAPLASTLYARVVFKEQLSLQQWIAIGLKLTGIVLLSIAI
ncbi:MAG: DMT family transporter [archaeon]